MNNIAATFGHVVVLVAALYLVHGIARFNNAVAYRGLERNRRKSEDSWPL